MSRDKKSLARGGRLACTQGPRPDQNDDEAREARGGGEGLEGSPLVWSRPHPRPRTVDRNDPTTRQGRGKEAFVATGLPETACAAPPRWLDPGRQEREKGQSEKGGDGGQTGP